MPELVTSINCPKCGGPLNLTTGEVIVTCPYCGTASRIRGDQPFGEYSLPVGLEVPVGTGGMVRGYRFLNAEGDEDEAERLTREDVDGHQRELLKDLVDVIEDARTQVDVKDSEFLHAPIWFSTYEYRTRSYTILLDAASGEVVRGDIPAPSGG